MEEQKNIVMKWVRFTGQKLETADLVWLKHNGLYFVDSGYTSGEPSRLSSMPEDSSFSFDNNGINKRRRDSYGSAYITNKGAIYTEKDLPYKSTFWDRILFILKISKPC